MTISTYAQLKTAITNWLDVSTTTFTSTIDDLVTLGEIRLFRECRTRDMENALSDTISASGTVALPTGYTDLKFAYIDRTPVQHLERRSSEWIYRTYPQRTADRTPKYIARETTNFIFGPFPDSTYAIKGVYYKRFSPLSSAVNALFTASPDLYLFACLAESEPLIGRDSRIALWNSKYQQILALVNGEDKMEQFSGSVLQMRVG